MYVTQIANNNVFVYDESLKAINNVITSMIIITIIMTIIFIGIILYIKKWQNENKSKLEKIAFYDSLTDEKNSTKFIIDAEEKLKSDKICKYQLLYLDIDGFKMLNDIFGYKVGDNLLVHISEVIKKNINKGELFCRGYADHFFLLMNYYDNKNTIERIKNIEKDIHMFEKYSQIANKFTIGYGVYIINEDDKSINKIMDKAEFARRFESQNHNKNIVFYDETMIRAELYEIEIKDRMYFALENEEFEIYFQAKYSISKEKSIGAEALVRWNIPKKGLLSPFEFIPIFEKNGFIIKLDMYVLDKVCLKISEWVKEGLRLIPVSVNMSRIHMRDIDYFIQSISQILKKYNIDSELIEIELTESALFEDTNMMIEAMARLKELGFGISLDDFGAGYSSLNILKDLPIDIIKLDKEFLDNNYGGRKFEVIICNIVKMAKELNLVVVAEGVETHEQAMFLSKIGCDIAQGYLYSKPMPAKEFENKELKRKN